MATSSEFSVPRDVTDWVASPIPFNAREHGVSALLSGDDSVVEWRDPDSYTTGSCVLYTQDPLPLGKVWKTTVLETTAVYGRLIGGLVSGCKVCIM